MKGPPVSRRPLYSIPRVPDLPPPSRDQTSKAYIVDSSLEIKGLFNYLFVRRFRTREAVRSRPGVAGSGAPGVSVGLTILSSSTPISRCHKPRLFGNRGLPQTGDAPDFVEVGEAGIAVGHAMRR